MILLFNVVELLRVEDSFKYTVSGGNGKCLKLLHIPFWHVTPKIPSRLPRRLQRRAGEVLRKLYCKGKCALTSFAFSANKIAET